jgi:hypothetical protein
MTSRALAPIFYATLTLVTVVIMSGRFPSATLVSGYPVGEGQAGKSYIGSQWTASATEEAFESRNPSHKDRVIDPFPQSS